MDTVIKDQWVKALRSGEYQQGTGALRSSDDEFCCLGVLCDIAVKQGVPVEVSELPGRDYRYDGRFGGLPHSVMDWAGMDDSMGVRPQVTGNPYNECLADVNDGGATFEAIADIIEREF